MTTMNERDELKNKLRAKLEERKITRSNRKTQEKILEKTLKSINIDKEKLKADMEEVKKQGGFSINLNK
jgi:hypothetical protein